MRRDLRLHDNAAFFHALKSNAPVLPLFIFDTNILDPLEDRQDRRVAFIHEELSFLKAQLEEKGSTLLVKHGRPSEVWQQLARELNILEVHCNEDYDPYARHRDTRVERSLRQQGIVFHQYKDHVLFHPETVLKKDGKPYTVFTPYARKCREKLSPEHMKAFDTSGWPDKIASEGPPPIPSLQDLGFRPVDKEIPDRHPKDALLQHYEETRNRPDLPGTTRLSTHLRFGTISIREIACRAYELSPALLNELLWRDFFQMILWHFPQVVNASFKQQYDSIPWRNDEKEFRAWCKGRTGYPIVDAGMRELNATGYIHNRVRMITASFLSKHLLVDWRWGEAYFARKLLDYELASNNGGWQWAAGSGCDAAPYFRIFNPYRQAEKFDPEGTYVHRWVPEKETKAYPEPLVDHKKARERALRTYRDALGK